MKAAILKANRNIEIEDIQLPPLSDENVRVKIYSCGICGSDIPRVLSNGAHFYPLILGHEFFGEVVEVGKGVTSFKKGDFVVGIPLKPCFECEDCKDGNFALCKNYKFIGSSLNGAYCEMMDISKTNLFKIDSKIANPFCALFEPSAVALHAIKLYDSICGKNVAIVGGGTIGTLIANWAKIYGAKSITLFERNLDNKDVYQRMGVQNVFVSSEEGFKDSLKASKLDKGFDMVFDAAGTQPTILFSLSIANNKADVCLVGTPTREVTFTQKQWEIINRKELTIKGSWMCYSNPFPGDEWKETNEKLLSKELVFTKDYFAGIFKLEDAMKAFEFIEKGKDGKVGRCLLVMNDAKVK